MGIRVIIHGFIVGPFDYGRREESARVFEHNKSAILALPNTPHSGVKTFFLQSMFAVHPPTGVVPHYDSNLITFGGTYKNMYIFESDWLQEFEQLLAKLCWSEASAFLEFGRLRCNWQAEDAFERAFGDVPSPPLNWSKSFLKLSEAEISERDQ